MQHRTLEDTALPEVSVRYSVDELDLLGRLLADGEFPGVACPTGDLEEPAREAVDAAVLRGLVLRNIVTVDGETVTLLEPHSGLLGMAFEPECLVTVETLDGDGDMLERVIFHATHDLTVRQNPGRDGMRVLTAFETPWLLVRVLDELGDLPDEIPTGPVPSVFSRITDVEVAWRDSEELHTAVVRVAHAGAAGAWLHTDEGYVATGVSDLYDRLALLLPPVDDVASL